MNRPSVQRLQELPKIFSTAQLRQHFGWNAQLAGVYLARWQEKQLITPAGHRLGLYYQGQPTPQMRLEAVRLRHPEAMLIGASALAAAGLMDPPPFPQIAVRGRFSAIDGVDIHRRPASLFAAAEPSTATLPALDPVTAVIDSWSAPDLAVDPDAPDIDLDLSAQLGQQATARAIAVPSSWRHRVLLPTKVSRPR